MNDLKNLKCLLPKTRELLRVCIEKDNFLQKYLLVGGSTLTLYICHLKSEDLDFFTYDDGFDKKEIKNQTDEQIDLLRDGVRVTFFNVKLNFLKPQKIERFNLASIEQIAARKWNIIWCR